MKRDLQALYKILEQKQQKNPSNSWLRDTLSNLRLLQTEEEPLFHEDTSYLQRSNERLQNLNETLAQFQMTTFKKLVDIMRPLKRPEKKTQTRTRWPDTEREMKLQEAKQQLQVELDRLRFETNVAKEEERVATLRYDHLKTCLRMTQQHFDRRRHLLEEEERSQDQEEELQQRRSVVPVARSGPAFTCTSRPNVSFCNNYSSFQSMTTRGHLQSTFLILNDAKE